MSRYAGRDADERRAERRRRLLDAGLELFTEQGFAATTVKDLYTRAGLAPRHLYEQVAGREELLLAVYEEQMAAVGEALGVALAAAPADAPGRLGAGLGAFVAAMTDDDRRARLAYAVVPGASPLVEARRREVVDAFAHLVAGELTALGLRDDDEDPRLLALALAGAANELLTAWVHAEDRAPPAALVRTLTRLFLAAVENR